MMGRPRGINGARLAANDRGAPHCHREPRRPFGGSRRIRRVPVNNTGKSVQSRVVRDCAPLPVNAYEKSRGIEYTSYWLLYHGLDIRHHEEEAHNDPLC